MCSRRDFLQGGVALVSLGLLSGCGILPPHASQSARVPRIALLHFAPASLVADRVAAFRQGLRDLGYTEGANLLIEYRHGDGQADNYGELAAGLVRLGVDIIVSGGPLATRLAKEATAAIPIVMTFDPDPVGSGFAASLARPGGNVTGLSNLAPATGRKSLELLREIVPAVSRVAVLGNSAIPGNVLALREIEAAATTFGIQLHHLEVREPADIETALRTVVDGRAEAIFVQSGSALIPQRRTILDLAARARLPVMAFAEEGGLLTYAANAAALDRRAATYVDKILKGAKPADLPIEQPTKFDFVVNLKTSQALGLTVPRSVLQQATEVIQ